MNINPTNSINFQSYNSPLKYLWLDGKLPGVTKGFYGGTLSRENLSLEHLIPHSQGGKNTLDNLVLADKVTNTKRDRTPIVQYINIEDLVNYLKQFQNLKLLDRNDKLFDGYSYIYSITSTLVGLMEQRKDKNVIKQVRELLLGGKRINKIENEQKLHIKHKKHNSKKH